MRPVFRGPTGNFSRSSGLGSNAIFLIFRGSRLKAQPHAFAKHNGWFNSKIGTPRRLVRISLRLASMMCVALLKADHHAAGAYFEIKLLSAG